MARTLPRSLPALLAAAALLAGCAPRRENVVLVVIDALRADRLGCYGHDRPVSPFIDSLARRSVVFDQAYAPAPWTVPSVTSLMTSLHPREHGCRHGYLNFDRYNILGQEKLDERFETLAGRMRTLGYQTYGVSANPHVAREMGLTRGFDHFETLWRADSAAVNSVLARWAGDLRGRHRRPWFLYIHYFDPHLPYVGREPWITTFSEGRTGYRRYDGIEHPELRALIEEARKRAGNDPAAQALTAHAMRTDLLDLYDSEIRFQDEHLRQAFGMLGIDPRRTTIILTSDHGEEFLEHDFQYGHGRSLYEPALRVPLLWCGPRVGAQPGTRIATPVTLLDIFPTLAALHRGAPPENARGLSLAATLATGAEPPERTFYFETERGPLYTFLGLRDGDWKFTRRGSAGAGGVQLINLARDPNEATNLAADQAELTAQFSEHLDAWSRDHPPHDAERSRVQLDESRIRELRSLGYLK